MSDLKKVEKVLHAVMKHEGAAMLFNEPVDHEGLELADYLDVVKQPMDLGTISHELAAGDYAHASEVRLALLIPGLSQKNTKPG